MEVYRLNLGVCDLARVLGNFQKVHGRRGIRLGVPSGLGFWTSLRKIFQDGTGQCR